MSGQTVLNANRRYRRDFFFAMIFYIAVVAGGPSLIEGIFNEPPKWVLGGLAVLSALPAAYVFLLIGRLLRETDEYMRQRMGSAMLVAAGITISFCFLWGFLELYELVPNLWTFLVGPIFFFSLACVNAYNKVAGA